jgi:hypothetical protein
MKKLQTGSIKRLSLNSSKIDSYSPLYFGPFSTQNEAIAALQKFPSVLASIQTKRNNMRDNGEWEFDPNQPIVRYGNEYEYGFFFIRGYQILPPSNSNPTIIKPVSNPVLANFRFPNQQDMKGDWKKFRKDVPVPYHIKVDLNGDGLVDDVWMMIKKKGIGYGVFVFFNQNNGIPIIHQMDTIEDSPPQQYNLQVADSGIIETWCGKSGQCKPGEPEKINLIGKGIYFIANENSMILYVWNQNKQRFESIFISD